MRASHGGPDALQYVTDAPKPAAPAAGQILVKNSHVGVNFIDTYHRTGLYKVALPFTLGSWILTADADDREAAGVVEAVGEGVTRFKVGDRVAYFAGGTYAEYALSPVDPVIKLPDEISFEDGAALCLQGATALSLTKMVYEVKKGDFVLIHAAAGGTGRLLSQVCRHFGAIVIGTTSSPAKAEVAKAAGCHHVILYTQQDVVAEVKRITSNKGCAVVYDGVGKTTFDVSLACLARLGTLASFGNASGKVDDVDIMKLVPNAVRLMRPSLFQLMQTKEDMELREYLGVGGALEVLYPLPEMVQKKVLNIHIHKIYDLKDAAQAHRDLEGRQTQGKLILKI
ncbi:hypothetical protein HK101_011876 [Irineochytrium annulatum]|nr:hypothetical protein HK101_011876 [Irineochytrium annulatum]